MNTQINWTKKIFQKIWHQKIALHVFFQFLLKKNQKSKTRNEFSYPETLRNRKIFSIGFDFAEQQAKIQFISWKLTGVQQKKIRKENSDALPQFNYLLNNHRPSLIKQNRLSGSRVPIADVRTHDSRTEGHNGSFGGTHPSQTTPLCFASEQHNNIWCTGQGFQVM